MKTLVKRVTPDPTDEIVYHPRSSSRDRHLPVAIVRRADGSATPALSNAELEAILVEHDLEQYRRVLRQSRTAA